LDEGRETRSLIGGGETEGEMADVLTAYHLKSTIFKAPGNPGERNKQRKYIELDKDHKGTRKEPGTIEIKFTRY